MKAQKAAFWGAVALVAIAAPIALKWVAVKTNVTGLQRLVDYSSTSTQA
jgi:hypothetical protein